MKKNDKKTSDHEEENILSSFENDEWTSVKEVEKEKKSARKTAAKSLQRCAD